MKKLNNKEALNALLTLTDYNEEFLKKCHLKYYYYLQTDFGNIIEVKKPKIENVMYYDDEQEAPSTALDSFKRYNKFYNIPYNLDEWIRENEDYKKTGCCIGNLLHRPIFEEFNNQPSHVYLYMDYEAAHDPKRNLTELNEKETEEFISIIRELENDYDKRLNTYYKRFGNKIYTYGYWANR